MARFYGEIQGKAKTRATREGTEQSGMWAHIRGWNIGVYIECEVDEQGKDTIRVYKTYGSNNPYDCKIITTLKED